MRCEVAAAYVGLSQTAFLVEVRAGRAPDPAHITAKRKIWLRDALDEYLDRLFDRAARSQDAAIQTLERDLGLSGHHTL